MEIEILSDSIKIYKGQSPEITFPGAEGQFQVLDKHCQLFCILDKGEIIIGKHKKISIISGITEVLGNRVVALVKTNKKL